MRYTKTTLWITAVTVLAAAGVGLADDRTFLQSGRAEPNLIFILDTSSSMAASPEVVGRTWPGCDPAELVLDTSEPPDGIPDAPDPARCLNGALVEAGAVPGGGDDPYSRMGIAKQVLGDFLETVGVANVALAGWAQAEPADGSNGIPQKHWVYEARAQDRFRMVEPNYAYRFGYNWNFNDVHLDLPADIYKKGLIGYNLYFNPGSTDVPDRFGPVRGDETGYRDTLADGSQRPAPYDLMPIYFGNCFVDTNHPTAPKTMCGDYVFPFYDSGVRDIGTGDILPSSWYYGVADPSEEDYPGCNTADSIWDRDSDGTPDPDACVNTWSVDMGGGITRHYQRRVRLEIPSTYGGAANHFIEIDNTGAQVGNTEVADGTTEDYDLDINTTDTDLDGSSTSDWMLYVNSVEQQREIDCEPAGALPTWTYTPTKTHAEMCQISITSMNVLLRPNYAMGAVVRNDSGYTAEITRTFWDWDAGQAVTDYVDWMCFEVNATTGYVFNYNYFDGCQQDNTKNFYWSDSTGSAGPPGTGKFTRPFEVSKVNCDPADTSCRKWVNRFYSGDPAASGVNDTPAIGTGRSEAWWAKLRDNATPWDGLYQVCFDFDLLGAAQDGSGANYSCPNICAVTAAGSAATPTPSPTNTNTPTETPFGAPTATPVGPTPTRTNTALPTNTSPPLPTRTSTPIPTATATFTPTPTRTPIPTVAQ